MQEGIATCYPLRDIQAKTPHTHAQTRSLRTHAPAPPPSHQSTTQLLNCGGPVLQDLPEAHFHSPKTKAKKHHNVAPCLGFGLGLRHCLGLCHCLGLRRCNFHDYPQKQVQNRLRLCLENIVSQFANAKMLAVINIDHLEKHCFSQNHITTSVLGA